MKIQFTDGENHHPQSGTIYENKKKKRLELWTVNNNHMYCWRLMLLRFTKLHIFVHENEHLLEIYFNIRKNIEFNVLFTIF